MPFINVENSGKGNNKGSCRALVNYLCKENEGKPLQEQEHFFSAEKDQINSLEVSNSIDSNVNKLGKKDSKFFMVTVNFSQKEASHISQDPRKIRAYAREVMDLYAKNFNKGLKSSDLVWFAKIEYSRKFKGSEPEVRSGEFRQGQEKPGLNAHVHIIISRKDKTQRLKLSPMTTHRRSTTGIIKSGFDRKTFKIECEKSFDNAFSYSRYQNEYFLVANTLRNGTRAERTHVRESIHKNQPALTVALSILKGMNSYYPMDEDEREKRRNKKDHDQDQDLHH